MSTERKILINASTVKISGGLYVTLDIIKVLLKRQEYEFKIIAPDIPAFRKQLDADLIEFVPHRFFNYLLRPLLDYIWLPDKIRRFRPDRVVSFSNLPARTRICQVFYHQNAFITAHGLRDMHLRLRSRVIHAIRKQLFRKRLKFVDQIVVQTELERIKMTVLCRRPVPVRIFQPLLPSHLLETRGRSYTFPGDYPVRIACLSRYFDHKNIEVLHDVAQLLYEHDLAVQLIVTLQKKQGAGARRLISKIKENHFGDRIYNAGKIPQYRIRSFIQSVDALILPSLCESFSINCLEAWYADKPFLVSDLDFGREVCGQGAIFFPPGDPEKIASVIKAIFIEEQTCEPMIRKGREKLRDLPGESEAQGIFLEEWT